LYPTIGLQTPGEIVEANFGQSPFVYDIENYIQVYISFVVVRTVIDITNAVDFAYDDATTLDF